MKTSTIIKLVIALIIIGALIVILLLNNHTPSLENLKGPGSAGLQSGQSMSRGQFIVSSGGRRKLEITNDGGVILSGYNYSLFGKIIVYSTIMKGVDKISVTSDGEAFYTMIDGSKKPFVGSGKEAGVYGLYVDETGFGFKKFK